MIDHQEIAEKEYYLVFTQGVTHWITRWLKSHFSHIYLVTKDEYNWILLNPTRLYLQVEILPTLISESPLPDMLQEGDQVLLIKFRARNDAQQYGAIGLLNCVTWTKYILGLRIKCLTPWRLFQRLINFKPVEMFTHGIISIEKVSR